MITAARAIKRGIYDFQSGIDRDVCPYPAPGGPTHMDAVQEIWVRGGSMRKRTVGRVRIDIDYREQWRIGWDIGELLAIAKAAA